MGFIVDMIFGDDDAEQAPIDAANIQANAQRESLAYLKEREAIPQQFREGALKQLGGVYGLEGGEGSQQDLIDQAKTSPLYENIMGGKELGEEAIMRNAGATGGLRSGNVQGNMYDYNIQLQNRALLDSYNEQLMGIQGLAGLPSNANNIAAGTAGIGQTLAQGKIASAQAGQQQSQNSMGNLMGIADIGLAAWGMFSDRILKKNIVKIDEINGHNFYVFDWNSTANKLGLEGSTMGCMADEVFEKVPEAVFLKNNFMMVNYTMIGVL
jgi:hypothetical protein